VLAVLAVGAALAASCKGPDGGGVESEGDSGEAEGDGDGDGDGESGESGDGESGDGDGETKFDLGGPSDAGGGDGDICKVDEDDDALGTCDEIAPPDSFEPALQWEGVGEPGEPDSIVTPLVANLTDDNDDGEIDLCDIPDVLVVASPDWYIHGHMLLMDGATGAVHFQFSEISDWAVTPAIGDIDADGIPEIVGAVQSGGRKLAAWEHDGTLKWTASAQIPGEFAVGLADLDADGDVEVYVGAQVYDHQGQLLWTAGDTPTPWAATTAADLDDDGELEIVLGKSAWRNDGSMLWTNGQMPPSQPQVADLDDDGLPEVLLLTGGSGGMAILEHDGTLKLGPTNPTGDFDWRRPAAIHDLDGDDLAEVAVSSNNNYGAYEGIDLATMWTAQVSDQSGLASGTAFDFLGDAVAEAIYGDESTLYVFDGDGQVLLSQLRSSGTLIEYPVVADVDNDGSSEIIVVSNEAFGQQSPLIQVIKDAEDRWIQARRIWNQHTYHVTNVREDGTIPQLEKQHWHELNTFRTNAQIQGGGVCKPEG
jgi:hypothetical protein